MRSVNAAGRFFVLACLTALLACNACGSGMPKASLERDENSGLILIGSETLVPLAQRLAEEWMRQNPESIVSVGAGGSGRGIKAVLDGVATIGLVSSPTEAVEAAIPKEKPALTIRRIARDAVIPIVNQANPVHDATLVALRGIFSGEIRNWSELGGPDAAIDVLTHDDSSGTYETWKERVMGEKRVILPTAQVVGTSAMLRAIEDNPNAIGYVAYASFSGSVRALSIGGVAPTVESISTETFPVFRSLKLVTLPDVDEPTRRFVDFCSDPNHGGRIQTELGMIPYQQTAVMRDTANP